MIYLSHEFAMLQADSRRFDAIIAQSNVSAAQQDQVAAAARASAIAARADVSRLNGQAAAFQSQAATDEASAADLAERISQQLQDEPDKFIDLGDGRQHPNPAWTKWKAALDLLTRQRDQASAAAIAARASASQSSAAAAQSQAAADAADRDAAAASASAAQLRQQASQIAAQRDVVTQQIAAVVRWQQELARQPLDRNALESSGHELSARIDVLESQYALALDLATAADNRQWYLQTLALELTSKIDNLNGQLPLAATEVANATSDLAKIQLRILHVMHRKPE